MEPIHIVTDRNNIANKVLMPGDPLRAKYIADKYLEKSVLVNSVRNMLGYTGYYNGKKITVIGSGMGMPSIGIYSFELYNFYNVDKIIRIGTGGSLNKNIKLLDVILAKNAYSPSSFAYEWSGIDNNILNSSVDINESIIFTAKRKKININYGTIMTASVFSVYTNMDHILNSIPNKLDILGNEMEAFALFHVANVCKKEAACLMTIVDSKYDDRFVSDSIREKNLDDMIILALESI